MKMTRCGLRKLTSKSVLRMTVVLSAIHATLFRISMASGFPGSWMGSPSVFILSAFSFLAYTSMLEVTGKNTLGKHPKHVLVQSEVGLLRRRSYLCS
jgi:hypothetical protein